MKFTANELRSSMELGSTSTWVVSFSSGKNFDVSKFNLIKNTYAPVDNVDYRYFGSNQVDIKIGPEITVKFITRVKGNPDSIELVVYDDDKHTIHTMLRNWVGSTTAVKGQAIDMDDCAIINIHKLNKADDILFTDSFYVFPTDDFNWKGDQSFEASSFPLKLVVKGRYR